MRMAGVDGGDFVAKAELRVWAQGTYNSPAEFERATMKYGNLSLFIGVRD